MQNRFSKKLGIIIVALLTISTLSAAIPFAAATITDRPTVYVDNTTADPLSVEAGTYVNITTADMTITGAQVWLWLSTYGGSEIDRAAGDRVYAGPFYLGDVTGAAETVVTFSVANVPAPFNAEGRTYSFVVGYGWINGTVPLLVQGSNVDYWIKIADQSPREMIVGSEVGVSNNRVRFTTGFGATPLSGAPDTEVTVSGYAIQTGIVYNITQGAQLVDYFVPSTTHNESGWLWTGFAVPFNIRDLQGRCTTSHPTTSTVTINVINHNTTATDATFDFTEYYREVYLPTGTIRYHDGDYTGYSVNTGDDYNVTTQWFPSLGGVSIYLNSTLVASGITLNVTGGNNYTTITIPALLTGDYFFRVIDNNLVEYNFTVHVVMVPYITVTPDTGYVGDQFTVTGTNFLDYVGDYITIYFENTMGGGFVMLWNETIASSGWVTQPLTVPQSWGGDRLVEARIIDGSTPAIASDTFTVLAKINVLPDIVNNTVCQVVDVEGTGFMYAEGETPVDFFIYIDNSMYFGDAEDWELGINETGYILFQFAAAGFRPGLHVVSAIMDTEGATPWTIYTKDNFWVSTVGDPIVEILDSMNLTMADLNATIIALDGTIATLDTSVGQMQVDLADLDAKIITINGNVATIKTSVTTLEGAIGQVLVDLDDLDAVITSLDDSVVSLQTTLGTFDTTLSDLDTSITTIGDNVVSIKTSVGNIEGTITSMDGTLATVETNLGTVKVDLESVQSDVSSVKTEVDDSLPVTVDMMPVWIAVVLALIAAIGSIAGVFIIQRKIA